MSKCILGTVQFGQSYGINNTIGQPSEKQIFEILDYASQQGVSILDTADAYGNASTIIGKYIHEKPGRFAVNTKFRKTDQPINEQIGATLNALQLKQIDTYFFHSYQDFKQYPELDSELQRLKEKKQIIKSGVSVYDNLELKSAIESNTIDVIQLPFNLLDNMSQRGLLLKEAKERGKEIQVRSVFLQGLFFKPLKDIPSKLNALIPFLKKIQKIAFDFKIPLEHLALQYVLQQPMIDHVIFGVDTIDQLKKNLAFGQETMPRRVVHLVNRINVSETELLYPKNWN